MSDGGRSSGRSVATTVAVVAALVGVWAFSTFAERDEASPSGPPEPQPSLSPPTDGIEPASLSGRLVFASNAPDGGPGFRQRLYVYDLAAGDLEPGPRIPAATELLSVADGSIVIVSEAPDGRRMLALVATLDRDAPARTFATGDLVAPTASGRAIQVLVTRRGGACDGPGYVVHEYRFVLGATSPWHARDPLRCGAPISAAADDGRTVTTIVERDGGIATHVDGVPVDPPLGDVAILTIGLEPTVLFVHAEPPVAATRPPVGELLVWPFAGGVRPAVDGLIATRFLSWSPDGRFAVVNGELDGQRAMWLVHPARGTASAILPSDEVELGTWYSGAAFDVAGNVFGAGAGVIVVATGSGTGPLSLPADAPVPAGPIVWLP